jgi:hypothetical protein
MKPAVAAVILLALCGCSPSNNVFLGRVEASVGTHTVVVTDCYRIHAPQPERLANGDYHYMPCRDAEIWIRRGEVTVNGASYGQLNDGDGVLVDHGVVSIQRKRASLPPA